jgi:hypothetical protein
VPIYAEKGGFGAIFDFRDFPNGTLWTTFFFKKLIFRFPAFRGTPPLDLPRRDLRLILAQNSPDI